MRILGIGIVNHDDSFCLIENNQIKNHFQFERYIRIKKSDYSLYGAVDYTKFNILKNEIENFIKSIKNIDYYVMTISNKAFEEKSFIYEKALNCNIDLSFKKYTPKNLDDYIKLTPNLYYVDHHIAHACYAFHSSPFKESDILAYDGNGFRYQSIFVNNKKQIFDLGCNSKNPDFMIGFLWSWFSYLFFKSKYHEGKMMGISAHGTVNKKLLNLLYDIANIWKNKFITLNEITFDSNVQSTKINLNRKLLEILNLKNLNELISEENFKTVMATLQYFSMEYTLENLQKHRTSDNLCISGGCALNGYINEEILKRKIYKKIHVPPAASDEGLSIGAALSLSFNFENKRTVIQNSKELMYLGENYIVKKDDNSEYMEDDELIPFIAKKISEGYVIGWYQGRSESGPRALGNRSILADPRNKNMKDYLNFKIKNREWYRPFAPSILEDEVTKWFITNGDKKSHFMTRILKYKKGKDAKVPAVTHIDKTARVQTVTEEINPRYYKLIKEFFKLTNVPILLNTSFNGKNEPIVETPSNAFKCFQKNNIDILVLENNVYFRNGDKNIKPFIEESNVDGNDR